MARKGPPEKIPVPKGRSSGPICPNSKCKKSEFAVREITEIGTSSCRVFMVYCTYCGRIISTQSVRV